MKYILSESSPEGSVTAAGKAYRNVLARNCLADFSRQEIDSALANLESQGCDHLENRDVNFQAAITRLMSRKDLSSKTVENILKQLVNSEYDLEQAEWERDCQRRVSLSHSTFRSPR